MPDAKMIRVKDIARAVEDFAPRSLQESYDNAGLQVGDEMMPVHSVMICLDVTEDIMKEAAARDCDMIVSHHPLLFSGLKQIAGKTVTQRIVAEAIKKGIAVYSAHTNLDSAREGVSYEIAHMLGVRDLRVLEPHAADSATGLGVVGTVRAVPKLEFLRKVKEVFGVACLRYSDPNSKLVVRRVAVCGGAGASLIREAFEAGADAYVTGDVRYHDFTTWGSELVLADIGHYESELCAEKILGRILRDNSPGLTVCFSETEANPVSFMC